MTARVLLFSPVRGLDPESGDTSYTEELLKHPPPGVVYTSYPDAIEKGLVTIHGRRSTALTSRRDARVFARRAVEHSLRATRAAYREPVWHVSITEGTFDVVHQHLFAVRQLGPRQIPVVTTAGYPLGVLYGARERWPRYRIRLADTLERLLSHSAIVPWMAHPSAVHGVYSETFRRHLIEAGSPAHRVRRVGTFIEPLETMPSRESAQRNRLLFIGRDFDHKGGPIALETLRQIRRHVPGATLTVVTASRSSARWDLKQPGVQAHLDMDRQAVQAVIAESDVLLLPTRLDCGAPLAVLEALRAGLPVVLPPDQPWLDDRLQAPAIRRARTAPDAMAAAILPLLSSEDEWRRSSNAAVKLVSEFFSTSVAVRELAEMYTMAITETR